MDAERKLTTYRTVETITDGYVTDIADTPSDIGITKFFSGGLTITRAGINPKNGVLYLKLGNNDENFISIRKFRFGIGRVYKIPGENKIRKFLADMGIENWKNGNLDEEARKLRLKSLEGLFDFNKGMNYKLVGLCPRKFKRKYSQKNLAMKVVKRRRSYRALAITKNGPNLNKNSFLIHDMLEKRKLLNLKEEVD